MPANVDDARRGHARSGGIPIRTAILTSTLALAALIPLAQGYSASAFDPVADEAVLVPILGAPLPAEIMDCEDQTIDLLAASINDYYWYEIYVSLAVRNLGGPRECVDAEHPIHNVYTLDFEPRGALLVTDPSFTIEMTYTEDGWDVCSTIHFPDRVDSNCIGGGAWLSASIPASGNAPVGAFGQRPYDLRGEIYDVEIRAVSTIDGTPSFAIEDNMTTEFHAYL